MDPEEGAAALVSGDVVMACLFGGNSIKAAVAVAVSYTHLTLPTTPYV